MPTRARVIDAHVPKDSRIRLIVVRKEDSARLAKMLAVTGLQLGTSFKPKPRRCQHVHGAKATPPRRS